MLMRFDPFRDFERLSEQAFGEARRTPVMPMDAYRHGDRFIVHFDLPGADPQSIDLTVEKNVLTVRAQRSWQRGDGVDVIAAERPQGTFSRQLFLGETLDTEHVSATYDNGVLTLTIPVAERAKPRRVEVTTGGGQPTAVEASSSPVENGAEPVGANA